MKIKLLSLFEKWAKWKNILALFALQMLFNLVIMPGASSSDTHNLPILDLQFFYTPQRAYEIISAYTPELRQAAAITRLTLDIIYPIVYGLMLCLLLVITFRKAFPATNDSARSAELVEVRRSSPTNDETASSQMNAPRGFMSDFVIFVPWVGVLFDYLENFGLATMYLSYPKEFYFLARMTSIFTTLKWTFIGIGFLLALIGAVKLAFRKRE
jgi:hypothetical protein